MKKRILVLLPLLLLFNSCAVYHTQKAARRCEFELRSIEANVDTDISSLLLGNKDFSFNLVISVKNPSDDDLKMNKVGVIVEVDDVRIVESTVQKRVEIPAFKTILVPMRVEVDGDKISGSMVGKLLSGELEYKAVGLFYFDIFGKEFVTKTAFDKGTF